MVVNDNAGWQVPHGVLRFIASELAPTGLRGNLSPRFPALAAEWSQTSDTPPALPAAMAC
ncbi:hypothetical protein C1X61_23195 [Pseudomonas sp. FW215-T2]|nr:hypothetical protein C1X61_23195 [Pseudomonas sp. FW215-T2]PNA15260.1 hypothetical protein C1X62_05075 [Pseudomonas sp. FW215-R3]PNB37334.1 hypothetical protein C1X63_13655 [Pseudomonas sp. FW305-131]